MAESKYMDSFDRPQPFARQGFPLNVAGSREYLKRKRDKAKRVGRTNLYKQMDMETEIGEKEDRVDASELREALFSKFRNK